MKLDYSSLRQLLLENGIVLHILMDADFLFDKVRLNRLFFGIDKTLAYSKTDFKDFQGNVDMRKQVKLPKKTLGVCAPLALESNGTIFTARKLRVDQQMKNPIKKLGTVFAKRVARTAVPPECQVCECSGHNTAIAFMQCMPCSMQAFDADDYSDDSDVWPWDDEDEEISDTDDDYGGFSTDY